MAATPTSLITCTGTEMKIRSGYLICVERIVNGKVEWLPIDNQRSYQEWNGCFTLLTTAFFRKV